MNFKYTTDVLDFGTFGGDIIVREIPSSVEGRGGYSCFVSSWDIVGEISAFVKGCGGCSCFFRGNGRRKRH